MDEHDEINLGVVQVEYENQRERLNERPETFRPTTTGEKSKIGCLVWFGLVWIIAGLFFVITKFFSL